MELLNPGLNGQLHKNPALNSMQGFCIRSLIFVIVIAAGACRESAKKEQDTKRNIEAGYKKPSSTYTDTLLIRKRSAVFFMSDSIQLQKIKSLIPQRNFENDTHDCTYQMRNARMVLADSRKDIAVVEGSRARYLLFKIAANDEVLIDLDQRNEMCGIFFFEPGKPPLFTDMMNIETEIGFYFSHD